MTPPTPLKTFLTQCKRRFGHTNPDQVHLEHWEWMVRHRHRASQARRLCGADPSAPFNEENWQPDWCFERFGASRTQMPDGRVICIGGEHEDYYDPYFCIYNDVVVLQGPVNDPEPYEGPISIYTYPEEVFPPTDFHSATLVDQSIIVIGSLGYSDERRNGFTPVRILDTSTYRFSTPAATGISPGWIYEHHHRYEAQTNSIIVRGGRVVGSDDSLLPNLAVHRLHLDDYVWEVVSASMPQHRSVFRPLATLRNYADLSRLRLVDIESQALQSDGNLDHWLEIEGVRIQIRNLAKEIHLLIEGELQPSTLAEFLDQFSRFLLEWTEVPWTREQVDEFPDPFANLKLWKL